MTGTSRISGSSAPHDARLQPANHDTVASPVRARSETPVFDGPFAGLTRRPIPLNTMPNIRDAGTEKQRKTAISEFNARVASSVNARIASSVNVHVAQPAAVARPARAPSAMEIRTAQRLLRENQAALRDYRGEPDFYQTLSQTAENRGLLPLADFVGANGESTDRAKSIKRTERNRTVAVSAAMVATALPTLMIGPLVLADVQISRQRRLREADVFGDVEVSNVSTVPQYEPPPPPPSYTE